MSHAQTLALYVRNAAQKYGGNALEAHREVMQKEACDDQILFYKSEKRSLLAANDKLYLHPVFERRVLIPGMDFTSTELFRYKELYAMADLDRLEKLGRRQFSNLLVLVGVEAPPDQIDKMFLEMDANNDSEIDFEEFMGAMGKNLGLNNGAGTVKIGLQGTTSWSRGEIIWAANTGMLVVTMGLLVAGLVYFAFVLVPICFAYFFTFLVAPVINILEFRPVVCGNECTTTATTFCEPRQPDPDYPGQRRYKSGFRRSISGSSNGGIYDYLTGCKFPHGMAVLGALLGCVAAVVILVMVIVGEVNKLISDQHFMVRHSLLS